MPSLKFSPSVSYLSAQGLTYKTSLVQLFRYTDFHGDEWNKTICIKSHPCSSIGLNGKINFANPQEEKLFAIMNINSVIVLYMSVNPWEIYGNFRGCSNSWLICNLSYGNVFKISLLKDETSEPKVEPATFRGQGSSYNVFFPKPRWLADIFYKPTSSYPAVYWTILMRRCWTR